nr:early nodulin-like protein 1 [Tanacetum cinerariifolium]
MLKLLGIEDVSAGNIDKDSALNPVTELANVSHCPNEGDQVEDRKGKRVASASKAEPKRKGKAAALAIPSGLVIKEQENGKSVEKEAVLECFLKKHLRLEQLNNVQILVENIDASKEFVFESTTCNQWNERRRLQVGDTVVFTYEAEKSLEVKIKQEDYIICNAPSPVNAKKYSNGYSVVKLNQTVSRYFVSCIIEINNDKIIVQVIADKRLTTPTSTPTPTPSCKSETIGIYVMSGALDSDGYNVRGGCAGVEVDVFEPLSEPMVCVTDQNPMDLTIEEAMKYLRNENQ